MHGSLAVDFYKDTRENQVHAEYVAPSMKQAHAGFRFLDGVLADGREFVCGSRFSLADIRFWTIYTFFSVPVKELVADASLTHLHAYLDRVAAKPGAVFVKGLRAELEEARRAAAEA